MISPIRPEQLKKRITIQEQDPEKDSYGELVDKWPDVATVYAYIEPTGGGEFYAAQKTNSEANVNVWIRYLSSIKPYMRVKYGERYFDILNVLNWEEGNRWLKLICRELI